MTRSQENAEGLVFDPEDWKTWPVPAHGVNTFHDDGRPWRLSPWGDGFIYGFERALDMAAHFHKTGEWPDD